MGDAPPTPRPDCASLFKRFDTAVPCVVSAFLRLWIRTYNAREVHKVLRAASRKTYTSSIRTTAQYDVHVPGVDSSRHTSPPSALCLSPLLVSAVLCTTFFFLFLVSLLQACLAWRSPPSRTYTVRLRGVLRACNAFALLGGRDGGKVRCTSTYCTSFTYLVWHYCCSWYSLLSYVQQ